MKNFIKVSVLICILCQSYNLFAQSAESSVYYVVIGGFANLDNATRYLAKAKKDVKLISLTQDKYKPEYALNPARNIHYVFILKTTDKRKAFALNIELKAKTEYKDSWVFIGQLREEELGTIPVAQTPPPAEIKPVEKTPEIKKEDEIKKEEIKVETPVLVATKTDSLVLTKEEPTVEAPKVKALPGKPFIFKLASKGSGKEVTGAAHVMESARASEFQSFKANEVAYLIPPDNKAGTYVVKIQAPGYKPAEKTIKFGAFDSLKLDQKETLVTFELTKVKSGDYIDFNNVHFIKNSALMNPDSQNELDGLVSLMKENPKYKIRIHGFCNGSEKREIFSRGTSDKFFELEPDKNKKHTKSAHELSLERAEIIKAYLINQGIESSRLSVKGEGGDIPLYGEKSAMASHNDRVEIEIKSN